MACIALLTDFGLQDPYAGILKGVISRINSQARIVDLAHEIPPFEIERGAFALEQSYRYFPEGTVFVAVVDPGVGGPRKPILIQTEGYFFVGPDNGIFSFILESKGAKQIFHLQNSLYFLDSVSKTFQGRDLFAPVAAHLSRGISPLEFGPTLPRAKILKNLFPQEKRGRLLGRVLSIDRFGNLLTNFHKEHVARLFQQKLFQLRFSRLSSPTVSHFSRFYADAKKLNLFLVWGSSDFLEVSMNQQSAADFLRIGKQRACLLEALE